MLRIFIIGLALMTLLGLAGWLFTLKRVERVESTYPPRGRTIELPGASLHYTDRGGGPALVLLHGASTNLRDFTTLETDLTQRGYRVIAVDRPGSGYSVQRTPQWLNPTQQAALIALLLQSLEVEESVWIGHSLAGSLVMAGLLDFGDRVIGGVMLAGAAYHWQGGVDLLDHLPAYPVVGPLVTHTVVAPLGSLVFNRGMQSAFSPELPTRNYRSETGIDLYLRPGQFTATARDIRLMSDYLEIQSKRYGQIQQPLLLIHGDSDNIVPAWNHADRLVKILPQSRYYSIPGGGHQPHHAHRTDVAQWISEFSAQVFQVH